MGGGVFVYLSFFCGHLPSLRAMPYSPFCFDVSRFDFSNLGRFLSVGFFSSVCLLCLCFHFFVFLYFLIFLCVFFAYIFLYQFLFVREGRSNLFVLHYVQIQVSVIPFYQYGVADGA